ncbi:hypothetical protein [Vreelandella sp. H-I2]
MGGPRLGDRHATPEIANQDYISRLVINSAGGFAYLLGDEITTRT